MIYLTLRHRGKSNKIKSKGRSLSIRFQFDIPCRKSIDTSPIMKDEPRGKDEINLTWIN